ncbi:hypothetical protein RHGRI_029405 [Rhododendron griersonianum]|uniref:Uncharacterized protein n=1 Tax=Rhododendron griersonianum TaxID=479676 RepID=A0AAV6IMZ4_9ERIC|nr:hypothetical protein RHGRI_029405 [Rhododendron griersonianum]
MIRCILNKGYQRIAKGNGSNPQVNVQSLSRQLAQVLSNPEDEAAQELITLLRRVVAPPSVVGVDANEVVHEQLNHDDVPRQAPQVYSNPTFESNMNMHNQPFVGPTTLRSTVRPTSFYQNIPSVYEVGNSSGYGQNVNFNHGQSPQNGYTGNHAVNNGPYAYSMVPNMPSNGNYANQTAQNLPNNGNRTYYQDVEGDIKIDVAQVIGKNPIVCDTLVKTEKPLNMPSSQPNRRGGQANYRQYSFELAQADPIFDELLKQKFITLSPGHILPSDKEKKGKEYCKWHNSFRHNTNNCVTFQNCVQDLIQKRLLQYAKGDKEPMGIDSNPFPKVEVNMVTASLSKRLGSTVEKKKREDENQMETDDELAKSHFSRFANDYLCIRCGREVEYGEAIMVEKEQKSAFSKSGIRFNTMGGNDLQIYVGAKLIYEGIDPGLFNRIESEHCYGPDDGPFLFRGNPVVPARPGVPSRQDLEAAGYQFPSRGRYPNHRGVGPRRGIGPRGGGPYGYGGHQPRMVMPPNQNHEEWSTLSHPKFPAEGWYTKVSTSQKRRLQRKFAARAYGDPWDHVFEPRERVEPVKVSNMVWTREQGETSVPKQVVHSLGGQDSNNEASSKSNAQPKGKKELKQSLKKKMEEFQKLIEADDNDLLDEGSE